MRKYRRHAVIIVLFIAAAITPPDIASQVMVAIPLYLLYEISILVVQVTRANKLKKEKAAA
jgi:sec-independent protein translocase protein TatC